MTLTVLSVGHTGTKAAATLYSLGTSKSLLEQFQLKNKKLPWYEFKQLNKGTLGSRIIEYRYNPSQTWEVDPKKLSSFQLWVMS